MNPQEQRLVRALRAAAAGGAPLSAAEKSRMEGAVLRQIGLRPGRFAVATRGLHGAWRPAMALGVAAALVWVVMRPEAGPKGHPLPPSTAALERSITGAAPLADPFLPVRLRPSLAELPAPDVRPVLIGDFETIEEMASLVMSGFGRFVLSRGGISGAHAFNPGQAGTSDAPLEIEVPIPERARDGIAGVSIWVLASGSSVDAAATVGRASGAEVDLGPSRRVEAGSWVRLVFPVPAAQPGDRSMVRFRFIGQGAIKLDRVEVWTTVTGAQR